MARIPADHEHPHSRLLDTGRSSRSRVPELPSRASADPVQLPGHARLSTIRWHRPRLHSPDLESTGLAVPERVVSNHRLLFPAFPLPKSSVTHCPDFTRSADGLPRRFAKSF